MTPKAAHLDVCLYGADLRLRLLSPTSDTTYLVSSHQLCSSSSVFRNTIDQGHHTFDVQKEHRSRATKDFFELLLSRQDPVAFGIVLYVLHARPDKLPESLSFETLLEIASVCDVYQCAPAMRLWDEIWMRPWRERALDPGYENWIFIAWVFDVPDVFGRLSKELIMNGIVHGGWFSVVRSNAEPVRLDGRIHEKIIRALIAQKSAVTDELVRECASLYSEFEDLHSKKWRCKHFGKLGLYRDAQACDNMRFGALHKGFKQLGILLPPGSHFENITLCELLKKLRNVDDYLRQLLVSSPQVGTTSSAPSRPYNRPVPKTPTMAVEIKHPDTGVALKIVRAAPSPVVASTPVIVSLPSPAPGRASSRPKAPYSRSTNRSNKTNEEKRAEMRVKVLQEVKKAEEKYKREEEEAKKAAEDQKRNDTETEAERLDRDHRECNPFPKFWEQVEKVVDNIPELQLSEFTWDARISVNTQWMDTLREWQGEVL